MSYCLGICFCSVFRLPQMETYVTDVCEENFKELKFMPTISVAMRLTILAENQISLNEA